MNDKQSLIYMPKVFNHKSIFRWWFEKKKFVSKYKLIEANNHVDLIWKVNKKAFWSVFGKKKDEKKIVVVKISILWSINLDN